MKPRTLAEITKASRMIINVENIKSNYDLHLAFKVALNFPEFYGMNWDAFWDGITGLIQMPEELTIQGFKQLKTVLPRDAEILENIIEDYNKIGTSQIIVQ